MDDLHDARIDAAAKEIWKADNTTLGIDPPESMEAWVEETEGYLELARAALAAADALLPTVEQIAEVLYYSSFDRGQTCVLWPDATGPRREAAYRQADAVRALFGEVVGDDR